MSLNFSDLKENDSQKQHLNLSHAAWNIIENDRNNFSEDPFHPIEFAKFLNTIFLNCYHSDFSIFPSNLTDQISSARKKYLDAITDNPVPALKDISKEILADYYLKIYMDELKQKINAYPKGYGKKFRLNNEAYDILCSFGQSSYEAQLFDGPGKYLKALFEEYSLLPYTKREEIFFINKIEKIDEARRQECTLLVVTSSITFEVIPYRISTDASGTYLYLAGKSRQCFNDKEASPYVFASFRISRISHIKCNKSASAKLSKEDKESFEKQISEKGIQFLLTDTIKTVIRLTDEGIQKYRTQLHLRPNYVNITDDNIYEFQSTPKQIEAYFFKFGKDAEILYPAELRNDFAEKYRAAFEAYQKEKH